MATLRFSLNGDTQYMRSFDALARELEDLSEPLDEIGQALRKAIGEQFQSEGAHAGAPWQGLSRAYAAWKEATYGGRPLLVREGDMRAALLSPGAVTVTPRRLVYEPDSDYAAFHQEGRGHMPQRKMVDLSSSDRRKFDRIVHAWLNHLRRGVIGAH